SEIAATVEKIQQFARRTFPPELAVHPTGTLILHTRTTGNIVTGQVESLALSAGVIFVLMSAMFLSTRVGFIAMVPNLFPLQEFGYLSGATMIFSLGADLLLTPALLATTQIITLWDLLYIKLGKDPHKTISIFANLRPTQAKIIALMGKIQSFPRGHAIIRHG